MPKKTGRSRRARRSRAKRSMRKVAPLAMSPRYFNHKCTGIIQVDGSLEGVLTGSRNYTFARFDYAGIVSDVIGINSPPRWAQVKRNYEQYAVTGFSMRFYPANVTGTVDGTTGSPGGSIRVLWTFEDVDTYDTSGYNDAQIVALDTFRMNNTRRGVSVYRSNRPLARQMQIKW